MDFPARVQLGGKRFHFMTSSCACLCFVPDGELRRVDALLPHPSWDYNKWINVMLYLVRGNDMNVLFLASGNFKIGQNSSYSLISVYSSQKNCCARS